MRPRAAVLFVLLACLVPAPALGAEEDGYIAIVKDGADPDRVAARHSILPEHVYRDAGKGFAFRGRSDHTVRLAADPDVELTVKDQLLAWASQTTPTGVSRIEAGASSGSKLFDADVAILDTGIDPDHPDLNVAGGHDCTRKKGDARDRVGHGTLVAGIVGARDNKEGVVGVAPGVRLWAVKVGDVKGAKTSDVICGIDWVTRNRATIEVANLSMSGPGSDDGACGALRKDALHRAICRSVAVGVTYVAAAGNGSTDVGASVPASYREVLTATAMVDFDGKPGGDAAPTCMAGADDSAAEFSNYAVARADAVHTIAAPGVCIASTARGGGLALISGTSASAPHVAGSVARCHAAGACRGLTPREVIARVRSDAADRQAGYGFLGDPHRPIPGRYYGHLVSVAGY